MAKFVIRKNCEYSIEVEADTRDAAFTKAEATSDSEWQEAWSPLEVDEDESEGA